MMALPVSGPLSMSAINVEITKNSTDTTNLNYIEVRKLAGSSFSTPGTTIAYSNLRGRTYLSFPNAGFEDGTLVDNGSTYTISGWTVYNQQVKLNGLSTIGGYVTPTNPDPTPYLSPGDNTVGTMTWSAATSSDVPSGTGSTRSLTLSSNGSVNVPYGIVRGPYAITNTAISLIANDTVSFWWKAQGGSDAYSIFAYLLRTSDGSSIIMKNETAPNAGATTTWAQATVTITAPQAGSYYFIFVSGSYDATGGQGLGAQLYIDEITVSRP